MFAISLKASKIPSPVVAHAAWMYHFRDVSLRKVIKSATSEVFSASAITKLKKKITIKIPANDFSTIIPGHLVHVYVCSKPFSNKYGSSESVGFFFNLV